MLRAYLWVVFIGCCLLPVWPLNVTAGPSDPVSSLGSDRDPVATGGERFPSIRNEFDMDFVYIAPGDFQMGSPLDEPGRQSNETPHRVRLSHGFYIMTTEVTQGQWMAVMGENPSVFSDCGPNCPVENVSWTDVGRFIARMNNRRKTNLEHFKQVTPVKTDNRLTINEKPPAVSSLQYRLPTEAQWEYACRAKTTGWFSFEGDIAELDEYAWVQGNSGGRTHPVALKKANPFGLYDLHGNVWEWCRDYAGPYPSKPVVDPKGPARGSFRIARGGSWYYPALEARSANRLYLLPESKSYNVGFRLILSP